MVDSFGRHINYMRISITDRCNLRCRYCMPEESKGSGTWNNPEPGRHSPPNPSSRTSGNTQGSFNRRGASGTKNITGLIKDIAAIPEIDDIAMTTNGILFPAMAGELKEAGLKRVNISMDTLNEERFAYITRRGGLSSVRQAIFKALELDMHPVKINVVVIRGFNDDEINNFARLAYDYPLHIRFIEYMPVGDLLFWEPERMMSSEEIRNVLQNEYELIPERQWRAMDRPLLSTNWVGVFRFISPMSHQFCAECDRIRLTADGKLRGCLYEKQEVDLKKR